MQFGAVTFVLAEAIFGKPSAEVTHHRVAGDLGDHAGGGDAQAEAIAVDDRGLWKWKGNNRQAVDQNVIGRRISAAIAARIALWVARRILIRSISIESTTPTAQLISGLPISS